MLYGSPSTVTPARSSARMRYGNGSSTENPSWHRAYPAASAGVAPSCGASRSGSRAAAALSRSYSSATSLAHWRAAALAVLVNRVRERNWGEWPCRSGLGSRVKNFRPHAGQRGQRLDQFLVRHREVLLHPGQPRLGQTDHLSGEVGLRLKRCSSRIWRRRSP